MVIWCLYDFPEVKFDSPNSPPFDPANQIVIARTLNHPDRTVGDRVITMENYRREMQGIRLWSSMRFDAVVDLVRSRPDARLVDFVMALWGMRSCICFV